MILLYTQGGPLSDYLRAQPNPYAQYCRSKRKQPDCLGY